MNQLFLVGRLTKDPEIIQNSGIEQCRVTLAVKRAFKNPNGVFETDFITCTIWNIIAKRVCEYCKKGDLISLKGRIQNNNYMDKDEKMVYSYEIIAEQVSFMQSSKKDEKELTDSSGDD